MAINERTLLSKITFVCLIIFIITSGISISFSQGMLILTLIFWLYGCVRKIPGFHYHKTGMEIYIGQFIIISLILALLSPMRIENLLYLRDFWLISAFVLASSLIKTKEDIKKIFYVFIIVALFQSLAAYIQYFADINYLNAFKYGIDDPKSRLVLGKIVVGFMGHHLTFGGYMMMISFPIFYMAFLKNKDIKRIPGIAIKGSAVMSFITLIISWARSVILAMPFALVPLLAKSKRIFVITVVIIAGFVLFIFMELGPYGDLSGNIYNNSSIIRIQIWKHAFNLFKEHPVTGTGGGNYNNEFEQDVKNNLKLDDQYYSALKKFGKSVKYLNLVKKNKLKTSVLFNKTIKELQEAELKFNEAELNYWGIEEFIAEAENNYNAVYNKLLLIKPVYEDWERKLRKANLQFAKYSKKYNSVEEKYGKAELLFIKEFPSMVTHAHNDYLNQLARKGIIGLLAFLYMLYGILKYMFDNIKSVNDRFLRYFYLGLTGSFTAFLAASMFQCYYTDDETLVMLWLNTGILAGIVRAR